MGKFFRFIDWIDLATFSCLAFFGLFILLSIQESFFLQQFAFLLIGFVLLIVCSRIDEGLIIWFAPIAYILSIGLLAVSYLGPVIRGATRWIVIGGFQFQPSELVKPLLLLAFSWAISKYPPRNIRYALMHFVLFIIPFFMVFKQPDLGSSLVYATFWSAMMIAGGFPLKMYALLLLAGIFGLPVIWRTLASWQQARILTFLNPALDPKGAGYNALQAMIAVGSGQLFGRGLGRGTQSHLRFLPEYHTDFIFATLVEELGFLGGFLLLFGYAILLWRILRPLLRGTIRNIFPFVFSIGLFTMLLAQVVINAGMNMGIIPITGITLPLVSYGGSSLISVAIAFGLLWAIRRVKSELSGPLQ